MGNSGSHNARSEGRPVSGGGFTPLTPSKRPGNIMVTTTQSPPLSPTIETPEIVDTGTTPKNFVGNANEDFRGHATKEGGGEGSLSAKSSEDSTARLAEMSNSESLKTQPKSESREFWKSDAICFLTSSSLCEKKLGETSMYLCMLDTSCRLPPFQTACVDHCERRKLETSE